MKTLSKVAFFMLAAIAMALPFAADSHGGAQNNSKNRRPRTPPPPPLPPVNSNGPGPVKEPTGPIPAPTCPGMRACSAEENNTPPQIPVAFPGPGGTTLHGHLYVPGVSSVADLATVTTKYPAMIYNHGSEPHPKGVPSLAKLYLDHGYVFFAPDRHGQGLSENDGDGKYHLDEQKKISVKEHPVKFGKNDVRLHELYNKDVIAAVEWFKQQPYVQPNHIGMTGISFGGIQTLITAEHDPGIAAYVAFAPAAESWGVAQLVDHLTMIVENEHAPMFIIQADGDYNLGPVNVLGDKLFQKGDHERWARHLYPKFGCTNQDAHGRFASECDGIAIWDQEILAYLNKWVKN
jgi:dienelactone hydrolase